MKHLLDFPAWSALLSGNKNLSEGNEQVKYFPEEVSPFVGMSETGTAEFQMLYNMVSHEREMVMIISQEVKLPKKWNLKEYLNVFQMVYTREVSEEGAAPQIVPLQIKDVPQMLVLTGMTHPGPFLKRTIEFGNYEGIFNNGELISMAGQRMHAGNYVEISAVCTHPDYLGKGYARSLIHSQVCRINTNSEIPFLHVRSDNDAAIHLYKGLGFEVRKQMNVYVFQKG